MADLPSRSTCKDDSVTTNFGKRGFAKFEPYLWHFRRLAIVLDLKTCHYTPVNDVLKIGVYRSNRPPTFRALMSFPNENPVNDEYNPANPGSRLITVHFQIAFLSVYHDK